MIEWDTINEFRPDRWPGDDAVGPDNMGDWGAWLSRYDGPLQDVFEDDTDDGRGLGGFMADDYLAECAESGVPHPADFAESNADAAVKDHRRAVAASFTSFIRAWKQRWIDAGRPGRGGGASG